MKLVVVLQWVSVIRLNSDLGKVYPSLRAVRRGGTETQSCALLAQCHNGTRRAPARCWPAERVPGRSGRARRSVRLGLALVGLPGGRVAAR
jgi:hypothetical protein